jgi:hypothetical protein
MTLYDDTIRKIIHLPQEFKRLGNISIYSLVQQTGYFNLSDKITASNIREVLKLHPGLVKDWLTLSEDKRSGSGWYFMEETKSKYIVGHLKDRTIDTHQEYMDSLTACATFIKREIEDIKNSRQLVP